MIFVIGCLLVFLAILVLILPNKIINTSSCKSNWLVILVILIGATLIIEQYTFSLYLAIILFFGIFINYSFPFLLNVITAFNRKSDP